MKPAALISSIFLFLVAAAHMLRIVLRTRVMVGDFRIPIWASAVAAVFVGELGVWLWREQGTPGHQAP